MHNFKRKDSGNALLYVFMAIGLLSALTYSFLKGSRENYTSQNAVRVAEEMYVQINLMKSAIMQCQMEFTGYSKDVDGDGEIEIAGDLNEDGNMDSSDNNNQGYPLSPSDTLNDSTIASCARTGNAAGCVTASENNNVRNLKCVEAPIGSANMFSGANNVGSFLPPKPQGFEEWTYINDSNGVYLQITAEPGNKSYKNTLSRLLDKFVTCQAEINYNNCGENCFTAWIVHNNCN